jgi:hypothetical protein
MRITRRQIRRIIREAINEVEFYDETPEGQLVGTEQEDARFSQQLDAEKQMKAAGLTRDEIAQMWPLIKSGDMEDIFMDTPMYEKLFNWFAFDGPELMPYGTAKARDEMPDEWIIDRLAA